eukprot:IDg6470t1
MGRARFDLLRSKHRNLLSVKTISTTFTTVSSPILDLLTKTAHYCSTPITEGGRYRKLKIRTEIASTNCPLFTILHAQKYTLSPSQFFSLTRLSIEP